MDEAKGSCRACGSAPATRDGLCEWCEPAAAFLAPTARERAEAVGRARPEERGLLQLAVLRGWRLLARDDATGAASHVRALARIEALGRTPAWSAYVAEDAVYGAIAWEAVAAADRERALRRAPVWLAEGRPCAGDPEAVGRAFGDRPDHVFALAFRLGSCGFDAAALRRVLGAMPAGIPGLAEFARKAAERRPTEVGWRPDPAVLARARSFRRLPLGRLDGPSVVLCGRCGEALPAEGSRCAWCGTPEDAWPPRRLLLFPFLNERQPCPVCGLDLAWAATPSACPCCLTPLPLEGAGQPEG